MGRVPAIATLECVRVIRNILVNSHRDPPTAAERTQLVHAVGL